MKKIFQDLPCYVSPKDTKILLAGRDDRFDSKLLAAFQDLLHLGQVKSDDQSLLLELEDLLKGNIL